MLNADGVEGFGACTVAGMGSNIFIFSFTRSKGEVVKGGIMGFTDPECVQRALVLKDYR